jgi:hypothetical protein
VTTSRLIFACRKCSTTRRDPGLFFAHIDLENQLSRLVDVGWKRQTTLERALSLTLPRWRFYDLVLAPTLDAPHHSLGFLAGCQDRLPPELLARVDQRYTQPDHPEVHQPVEWCHFAPGSHRDGSYRLAPCAMCLGADLGKVIEGAFATPKAEAVDMNIPNIRRLEG